MLPASTMANCPGTLPRRALLRFGLTGLSTLGLSDLLRLQQAAAAADGTKSGNANKSMIVIWLWGGASHMETFDLKPHAPVEYRGEFRPIATSMPGIEICEHLPKIARLADKFSLVRSLHHDSPGHVNSTHTLMTGRPGEVIETPPFKPKYPDFWAVANKVAGSRRPGAPVHVALPRLLYNGSAYLDGGHDPLLVSGDPNAATFQVPNLTMPLTRRPQFVERRSLKERFDQLRRGIDSAAAETMDAFDQQAAALLSSNATARAFDIGKEDPRTRDRYGRNVIGQRTLLARRLVEAGVRLVTVDFPCVPGQKAFSWDDHASVWNIFEQMKIRLPVLDQLLSALIADLDQRGMLRDTMVVVMGEMSHTPKLSNFNGQPGREHWSRSMTAFLAGGPKMGQVIGSTNSKGDEPATRPVSPADLLATWYHHLGVPLDLSFTDRAGRPVPLLPGGAPIAELT